MLYLESIKSSERDGGFEHPNISTKTPFFYILESTIDCVLEMRLRHLSKSIKRVVGISVRIFKGVKECAVLTNVVRRERVCRVCTLGGERQGFRVEFFEALIGGRADV